MAFSLVPSCFHGYLTSSSFSSTIHFLPTSLSCGGVSVSPVSKLRTCAKFDKFQGDSPLEQTTSASASQEVPLEAEDPQEEEEDDRFSNTLLCYKNWVFLCFCEGKASSIQSLSLSSVSLMFLCVYWNNNGTYGLKVLWVLCLLLFFVKKHVEFESKFVTLLCFLNVSVCLVE